LKSYYYLYYNFLDIFIQIKSEPATLYYENIQCNVGPGRVRPQPRVGPGRVRPQPHIGRGCDCFQLRVGPGRVHAQPHVGFLNIIMCVINIIISLIIQIVHIKNIIICILNIIIFIIAQIIDIKNIIICVIIII
jgi:hypothetical protein